MAGTSTPIRISDALLREAREYGERAHRSATAQIERWAQIGRLMEARYSQVQIESIALGVRSTQNQAPQAPATADIVAALTAHERDGSLATAVASPVRYRANRLDPDLIDEVTAAGVRTGRFADGQFVPLDD